MGLPGPRAGVAAGVFAQPPRARGRKPTCELTFPDPVYQEVRLDSIWLWPLGLVAFLLALPGLRSLAALIMGSRLRAQALSAQPDHIYLLRAKEPTWRNPQPREATDRQLGTAGFVEAGAYVVREMPDLTLALYAHPAESAYAVVYDHPRSGLWAEFVTRYDDGTLATYSNLEPMDVDMPEGSVHVAAPHLSPADLWKKMLAERPNKSMLACTATSAAQDFERGYAESVAYHRQHAPAYDAYDDGEEMQQAA